MMFSTQLVSVLLAASAIVQASPLVPRGDDDFGSQIVYAICKNDDLSIICRFATSFFKSDDAQPLINILKKDTNTLILPVDSAFDHDNPSIGNNERDFWFYSTTYGTPENDFKTPDSSSRKRGAKQSRWTSSTPLKFPSTDRRRWYGLIDGNQVQVIDQASTTGSESPVLTIGQTVGEATVVGRSECKGISFLHVDKVVKLPGTVSDALCKPLISDAPDGFVKFGGGLQKAGLLDKVDNGYRSTVFAPIDDGFGDFDQYSDDDKSRILQNHFFFGKVVYSTIFKYVPEATAQSGKQLNFYIDNGVEYVSCGSTKAMILRSDVTTQSGVLHVIDKTLKCD